MSYYWHLIVYGHDNARYWSKIMIFFIPPAFDAPVRWSRSEYCHKVDMVMVWQPHGEKKFDDMFSCFDTITACDGLTTGILVRAYAAHRKLQLFRVINRCYRIQQKQLLSARYRGAERE